MNTLRRIILFGAIISLTACASADLYRDPKMDFGSIQTVAVMPFSNLSKEPVAGDRVRDVFMTMLLATGDVYVLPQGEVARGIAMAGIVNPTAPTKEEILKFGPLVKADAVITAVVREYGEVRSGSATANAISVSFQMTEVQTGRVVLSLDSTRGGIGITDRLFGGGGEPMNTITEKTVQDVINNIYK
ncbi:MAG TPA: penicillin-binding protein activator LpoB [Nitrospirota bacterium]|nr:penicillin-binding protein activator LpoB [Nitrospirota bacterium]